MEEIKDFRQLQIKHKYKILPEDSYMELGVFTYEGEKQKNHLFVQINNEKNILLINDLDGYTITEIK